MSLPGGVYTPSKSDITEINPAIFSSTKVLTLADFLLVHLQIDPLPKSSGY
jgi:hypothetical protein